MCRRTQLPNLRVLPGGIVGARDVCSTIRPEVPCIVTVSCSSTEIMDRHASSIMPHKHGTASCNVWVQL